MEIFRRPSTEIITHLTDRPVVLTDGRRTKNEKSKTYQRLQQSHCVNVQLAPITINQLLIIKTVGVNGWNDGWID